MKHNIFWGIALAVGVAIVGGSAVAQEDAKDFYDGNTIKWIIPSKPGGGYDAYSRLLLPFMEKYTGAKIELVNVPGAGGMKGANELFNSPGDGLTLGIFNGSAVVTNQLAEIKGARYRISDYGFLGRVADDNRVLVMPVDSPFNSLKDLMAADRPILLGATGLGGTTYVDAVINAQAYGLDQKVIHGFNASSDIRQALLRGDIDGMWGSMGSALSGVTDGDFKIILQSGHAPIPGVGDVASSFDYLDIAASPLAEQILTAWDALNSVGRPVAAPPNVPEDRLAFLREAFDKSMNDPEFIAAAEKSGREISYADAETLTKLAIAATEMPADVRDVVVAAIRGEI